MAMVIGQQFDIAVSFASEQREYVEQTVTATKDLGLKVFYDKDASYDWWGRNFIVEQRKIYGGSTLFVVPFISKEYLARPFPMDEFSSAMMKAVKQPNPYILPILVGEVDVPAEMLHPHIGTLRVEDHTPVQLAERLKAKVDEAKRAGRRPEDLGALLLPKMVPATFSKYRELDAVLAYFGERFEAAGRQMESVGYVSTVRRGTDRVFVSFERGGRTEYALRITMGGQGMGEDKLTFSPGEAGSGMSAWVEPFYDRESERAMLRLVDFSLLGRLAGQQEAVTKEEFFDRLWEKIVEALERFQ
jgi:hypothetical protein